ncbi:MAG: bifunctional 2-polyprenyl-6-hydroxyphenol methylase/3-demethylubiquinol 3-O-methyltransferase UbiG [Alphaproteobacteria bacterium]|nr:bifunctional 2-polyprenyl-6-hydroxyphenol methylase/3-demethylubiquinol 3-O-methyltransferase UbiG [Alphaproteobacteria bacterium]MCB9931189.1 bifunctional 2-polyprenyl-6-hydroxyphenol methylase/3-demethylubiquinol 3-O-methyltransferase UbiG [Alphaproteobacteria bacterium]
MAPSPNPADFVSQSADPGELAQFARHARDWWDREGPFAPLHRINPARLGYVRSQAVRHLRLRGGPRPLDGITALDIGCGGGLVAEPLARMGAETLGIDLVPASIAAARQHAKGQGLPLTYRVASAEEVAESGRMFDLVTCLEVVEHVTSPRAFLATVGALVKPGGVLVLSTLNRNLASLAFGKIAAEYLLRWVPAGTHDWRKFLHPSELAAPVRAAGLRVVDVTGLNLHPVYGWQARGPATVNYLLCAVKPAERADA